ncbi:MAG: hypothetical protein AAF702_13645 [Chloroflexota bacterium]
MKAMLYHTDQNKPVAVFDEIKLIEMNDNHAAAPYRITYKAEGLNSGKTMLELHRDEKMTLKMDDGRSCDVLLQHSSLDMEGNAVGVLRVLSDIQ